MDRLSTLKALFLQWEDAQDRGESISAEQLCRDCPELLPELQRRIDGARKLDALLQSTPVAESDVTQSFGNKQGDSVDGEETDITDQTPNPLAPERPRQAGRYQVVGQIGAGGMGAVLRVRDPDFDRTLAVKIMLPEARNRPGAQQRFLEEAKITGQLQHPGIPPAHELGRLDNGMPFFAMKLIEGRTLAELLKARPGPDHELTHFLSIFGQICQTLGYAHSKGIIHRDLKPHNIMVGAFGEVQVMDWGLAKVLGQESSEADAAVVSTDLGSPILSHTGDVMGTPAYMAPEQARGEIHTLDARCDVFGLGAILCQILTGKPPFYGKDGFVILQQAQRGDVTDVLQCLEACGADAELKQICRRCLAPSIEDRPETGGAVADAVSTYQKQVQDKLRKAELAKAQAEVEATEQQKRLRVERQSRRWTLLAAVAGLLLVVGSAAGLLWYQQVRTTRAAEQAAKAAQHSHRLVSIEDALNDARKLRVQLHANLANGGIFKMINTPDDWLAQIKSAEAVLKRARNLADGSRVAISTELLQQIEGLAVQLNQDSNDRNVVLELEKIREEKWILAEGKFDWSVVLNDYSNIFAEIGVNAIDQQTQEYKHKFRQSPIRIYLASALTDWALTTKHIGADKDHGILCQRLLKLARTADPHPWFDQLRQPTLWHNREAVKELVTKINQFPTVHHSSSFRSPQAYMLLGYLQIYHNIDCERYLRCGQKTFPSDYWLALYLGHLLRKKNQIEEAIGFYRTALAIRPSAPVTYHALGVALNKKHDLEGAIFAYRKAIHFDGNYAKAHKNLAYTLVRNQELDEAIKVCEKAIQIDEDYGSAYSILGGALGKKGDLVGAVAAFQKAIQLGENSALDYNNLGSVLFRKGELNRAILTLKIAIELDDNCKIAFFNLSLAYKKKGELNKAIQVCKNAIQIDNNYAEAHNQLGLLLQDSHDLDGAIKSHKKAIEIDSTLVGAYNNLGLALRAQKDLDGAILVYKKAIEIDDTIAEIYHNLGIALAEKKELAGAISAFNKSISIDKHISISHFNLGILLAKSGRFTEALNSFQVCKEQLKPQDPLLRQVEKYLGKCKSLVLLESQIPDLLKSKQTSPTKKCQLANICKNQFKRFLDAVLFYEAAITQQPKLATDLLKQHRYNASCAALLAADGKGKAAVKLTDIAKTDLRKKAINWLRNDINTYYELLDVNVKTAVLVQKRLQYWQSDTDLSSVREVKALAKLPKAERQDWQLLWTDVAKLHKQAQDNFKQVDLKGMLTKQTPQHIHEVKLSAGKEYVIEMKSKQFDTYLKLQDSNGKLLAENDDINYKQKLLNSRLTFTTKQDGNYRLVATSYQQRGQGAYDITVLEFSPKKTE